MMLSASALRVRIWLRAPYAPYILLGVLLRIVVMPYTIHFDALLMFWQAAETVASGHFNPYDYAYQKHGAEIFSPIIWSPYGPAFYATSGLWEALLRWSGLHSLAPWTVVFGVPQMPRAVTLFKLLYGLVECVTVTLLCRVTEDGKSQSAVAALWLLNPVTLYVPYLMAQNDLLPVACVVVSLWAGGRAIRSKTLPGPWAYLAVAALGFGGAYKLFPLACVPVAALLLGRRLRDQFLLLVAGGLPFLLCIAPFFGSQAFRYSSLFNPEATGVLAIALPWPSTILVPIVVVSYGGLLFFLYEYCALPSLRTLCSGYFVALLTLFVFQPTPLPQWFLWIVPCLTLFCAAQPRLWTYVAVQSLFFGLWIASFSDVNDLGLGLFRYITSDWLAAVPPLSQQISPSYPYERLLSAAYGLFLCALLFVGIGLWRLRGSALLGSTPITLPRGFVLVLPLCVVLGVLGLNLAWGGRHIVIARSEQGGATTAPLTPVSMVTQSFVVPSYVLVPALSCVELRLRTDHPFNMTPVEITVADTNGGAPLATARATPSGSPPDAWQPFCFSPVRVQPGGSYQFTVSSPDPAGTLVVVRNQEDGDAYADGHIVVDGHAEPDGSDLDFRVHITLSWPNVWQDLKHRYSEDPALFALHSLACAAVALALAAAVGIKLVSRRAQRATPAPSAAPLLSEDNV